MIVYKIKLFRLQQIITLQVRLWWFCWHLLASALTFSAFDISGSICLQDSWDYLRIRNLNFSSNFTIWFGTAVFLTTSMPHDEHTFHACDKMMSGWHDSLMLKLALQPVGDQSLVGRQSLANYSHTSCWRNHSQRTHEICRRPISNRSATVWWLVGDWLRVFRKP